MSLRQLYKSHYEIEIVRKGELTSALALPVGILSLVVGALLVMAKELHRPLAMTESLQLGAIVASVVAACLCAYFLIRSLYNFAYGYVATPDELRAYHGALVNFHIANGVSVHDAAKAAEEETLAYVDGEYAKYADRNSKNNDIKSKFLHKANGAMVASVVLAGFAGVAHVSSSLAGPASVPKVEVVNIKELTQVPSNQPSQAATTPPPPPPPPAPAVRPTPPPGRVIKEDRSPPRPPPPPRG